MVKLNAGDVYTKRFIYSQHDVEKFAEITGDNNPVHLNEDYAKDTIFGRRILHGMLSASIFSKIFGTEWPGNGTIYLGQNLSFRAPMYVNHDYTATLTVRDVIGKKISIKTEIYDEEGNKTIDGTALIMVP